MLLLYRANYRRVDDVMNESQIFMQLELLVCAIGNVIDDNPSVQHITFPEIYEWIEDIMVQYEKTFNIGKRGETK